MFDVIEWNWMEWNKFNRVKYNDIETYEWIFVLILRIRGDEFETNWREVKELTAVSFLKEYSFH